MNIEIRTEKLTNNVVNICETVCKQHEICIQMLEGKEYQTLYKVMKKEQRILRLQGMIQHQIAELAPFLTTASTDSRRLFVSKKIVDEFVLMKDNARTVAEFANRCKDHDTRMYVQKIETKLVDVLRKIARSYQKEQFEEDKDLRQLFTETEHDLEEFRIKIQPSEWKQSMIESMSLTLHSIYTICDHIYYLYTGESVSTSSVTWKYKH